MEKIYNNAAYIVKKLNELYGVNPGKKVLQEMRRTQKRLLQI